jgi:ABC-type transporter Mla subunit MlaD
VVQKVKREIAELLDQLDTLSSKNAALLADRDAAYERLDGMQEEINDWQTKHHQLLRQQQEEEQEQETVLELGSSKTDGVISEETLVTYQTCVDALVKTSR